MGFDPRSQQLHLLQYHMCMPGGVIWGLRIRYQLHPFPLASAGGTMAHDHELPLHVESWVLTGLGLGLTIS